MLACLLDIDCSRNDVSHRLALNIWAHTSAQRRNHSLAARFALVVRSRRSTFRPAADVGADVINRVDMYGNIAFKCANLIHENCLRRLNLTSFDFARSARSHLRARTQHNEIMLIQNAVHLLFVSSSAQLEWTQSDTIAPLRRRNRYQNRTHTTCTRTSRSDHILYAQLRARARARTRRRRFYSVRLRAQPL